MPKYKGMWWNTSYYCGGLDREATFLDDVLALFDFDHTNCWQSFPAKLYPTRDHLPVRRQEIELFPELRRNSDPS